MSDIACCKEMCDEIEDEFEAPVEAIMKCDEFKSNFARQLSNRYDVNVPVADKNDDKTRKTPTELNIPDSPEKSANLPETDDVEDNYPKNEVDPASVGQIYPDINSSIDKTEITDLKRTVETLQWQLHQVESNSKIHKTLLKQVVIFLNTVKDHMENQEFEKKELPVSIYAELPRSRSVVHVNKNLEGTLSPVKKTASKRLSKSISNVNRFKEYNNWESSKTSVAIDTKSDKKILEEMKRLIVLATTLLNTKIPNLASQSGNAANVVEKDVPKNKNMNLQKGNKSTSLTVPTNVNIGPNEDRAGASCMDSKYSLALPHSSRFGIMTSMSSLNLLPIERKIQDDDSDPSEGSSSKNRHSNDDDDSNDNKNVSGLEDESGFSSLNSLQEIGIPIIQVILETPPTPPEEELVIVAQIPAINGYGPHPPEAEKPTKECWV